MNIDDRDYLRRVSMDLRFRVDALVMDLFGNARRNGAYWSLGNLQGDPGSSLYIHRTGPKAGKWTDAATGEHGDMLDLIKITRGAELRDAVKWADQWLGTEKLMPRSRHPGSARTHIAPSPDLDGDDLQRAMKANSIWREAQPIQGTPAERYLRNRGITIPIPRSLRYHPALAYWAQPEDRSARPKFLGNLPALVAAIQQPDGKVTAVHRVWIKPDGSGKADVPKPKLALGHLAHGAIRLAAAGRVTGESEGIEKSLAAMQLFSLPVWCPISASRLGAVTWPNEVEHVVIFGDHDKKDERETIESVTADGEIVKRPNPMFGKRPGAECARRATEEYQRQGLEVTVEFPEVEEQDWDDLLPKPREAA